MKKLDTISAFILTLLVLGDGYVWYRIASADGGAMLQFLDVGQGDSQLLTTDGAQIMTDFGPKQNVARALEAAMPASDRYIDLAIITHPETDHFGGLRSVLEHYEMGAILWNGYERPAGESTEWDALRSAIADRGIPFIALAAGDRIRVGKSEIKILSPDPLLRSGGETNDAAIVQEIRTPDFTALLTADIGSAVEEYLVSQSADEPASREPAGEPAAPHSLHADILKIAHHGSRFSSSERFLAAVAPQVAVIQSGKGNTYKHPHDEVLGRIKAAGIPNILRNDEWGTITIARKNGALTVAHGR